MSSAAPTPPLPPFTARVHVREAAISTLLGVGVVFLMLINRPGAFGWRLALFGALSGLAVFVSCFTLYRLVGERVSWAQALPRPVVAGAVFLVGGAVGWGVVAIFSQLTGLTRWNLSAGDIATGLAIAGGLGIAVGLMFFFFGRMRSQLAESVSRLKDAEFAQRELEVARAIQKRLLPPSAVAGAGYRVFARNVPAGYVAGDFYDVFHLGDGALGLVVADVSGKGLGASLIMASVKAIVPLVAADRSAADALRELNRKLHADLSSRDFVALCFSRYDGADGTLEIANAGLPNPYGLLRGDRVEELTVPGPRLPLGMRPDVRYESLRLTLEPGERVLFLTDGLPEAPTAPGEPLGYESLARLVGGITGTSEGFLEQLFESIHSVTSDSRDDDWTALLLERPKALAHVG